MAIKFLKGMNDEELAGAMRSGYREALGILYDKYAAVLFGFICRIVESEDAAERALQLVFVKAWSDIKKFDAQQAGMLKWLTGIARIIALQELKTIETKKNRAIQTEENFVVNKGYGSVKPKPSDALFGNDEEKEKAVLELIYYKGVGVAELAAQLGMEAAEVKSTLRMAVQNLRGLTKHEYDRGIY